MDLFGSREDGYVERRLRGAGTLECIRLYAIYKHNLPLKVLQKPSPRLVQLATRLPRSRSVRPQDSCCANVSPCNFLRSRQRKHERYVAVAVLA
jgi:hypothetical protein